MATLRINRFALPATSALCQLQHLPNRPITLTTSVWDSSSLQFSPPLHRPLSLSGDVELLTACVLHNFFLGESLLHVAVRKGSELLIGCFDAESLDFKVLVEVDLPHQDQLNKCINSRWAIEGCWLVDGPVFVAQLGRKFVIVQSVACEKMLHSDTSVVDDGCWYAYVLNLGSIGGVKGVRPLYCGELGPFQGSKLLLSIEVPSMHGYPSMASHRFRVGWNFVELPVGLLSCEKTKDSDSSTTSWHDVSIGSILEVCNHMFPPDMCPDLISCVGIIPRDSVTASLSIASLAHEREEPDTCSHEIIIGYWNGEVVKYRMGAAIAHGDVDDAPTSFQFAVVALGHRIVLCNLNGDRGMVVALCAETLHVLKAWSNCQDVVVGDYQMIGHDQLLLLGPPSRSEAQSTVDSCLSPQQLTDLETCFFSSIESPSQPDLPGMVHLREMEEQRIEKAELVRSSCKLLQDMAQRDGCSCVQGGDSIGSKFSQPDFFRRTVKCSIKQHVMSGRTWFLVVNIQNVSQENVILEDLNLSLTTVTGPISGRSSVLESLRMMDEGKHLVVTVSLTDLPDALSCPMLHILLGAKASKANNDLRSGHSVVNIFEEDQEEACHIHKAWIGQVEMETVWGCNDIHPPSAIPLEIREVAPRLSLTISACTAGQVVNAVKTALKMQYRVDMKMPWNGVHELVASQGALWADATIVSEGKIHTLVLRAEDWKHLSVLRACLLAELAKELDLCIDAPYQETIKDVLRAVQAFQEEIEHRKCILGRSANDVEGVDVLSKFMLEQCELQMSTDRCVSSLLARMDEHASSRQASRSTVT